MFLAPKEEVYAIMATLRGVAQFGSALVWGTRGRRFKSCHSDSKENRLKSMVSGGFFFEHLFVIFRFAPNFAPNFFLDYFGHHFYGLFPHGVRDPDIVGKGGRYILMAHQILEDFGPHPPLGHLSGKCMAKVIEGKADRGSDNRKFFQVIMSAPFVDRGRL